MKPELEKCICLTDDKYENHEDRVLRTGGSLILKMDVENLWDTALSKMCSVLEDQFSRMQTANHLLLIKDYVSLLGVTLRRYGYPIDALLDVLSKHRDKYHELLWSNCRKQMTEALSVDKLEQMYMKKEYEYSMMVLSFQIQTSNIMPAFPYVAPFSSMVPDCCRIVRPLIEDSVSYMSHGGQLDFYDVVKKYLDRLLSDVLDEIQSSLLQRAILFHDSYIVEVNLFGIDSILREYGQGYPDLNLEDKVLSKGGGNVMIQVVMDYSTNDNGQSKPQSPSQVNKQSNLSEEYRIGIG